MAAEGEGSGAVVVEGPTPFTVEWWRRTGAGRTRCGGGGRRRRSRWKGRGSWRWKTSPTGGPHLSARGRERGEEAGRWWAESGDGPRGEMVGWVCFFSNLFQTFLNQIFYIFSNSNFHTNFSNCFKGFSQTIFNNFSNIFKFKLLHKFLQTFSQIF
jgi:hypothetical protein